MDMEQGVETKVTKGAKDSNAAKGAKV